MVGLERINQRPDAVEELRIPMLREFFPKNVCDRAKARLMKIRQSATMNIYIY